MKEKIINFWNKNACGEELFLKNKNISSFLNESKLRYEYEPYIIDFADFSSFKNKKVLEIGVGMGSDHYLFAKNDADLYGIDLTNKAIDITKKRLSLFNLKSNLSVGDAESLKFKNDYFDLVYSFGVMHHSSDCGKCINEAYRVLKYGGKAKIMIYNKYSLVCYYLWLRYALFNFKPFRSLDFICSNYLESPGTKAFTINQIKKMFLNFSKVKFDIKLSPGDLLYPHTAQRHKSILFTISSYLMPRFLISKLFNNLGLFILIEAEK